MRPQKVSPWVLAVHKFKPIYPRELQGPVKVTTFQRSIRSELRLYGLLNTHMSSISSMRRGRRRQVARQRGAGAAGRWHMKSHATLLTVPHTLPRITTLRQRDQYFDSHSQGISMNTPQMIYTRELHVTHAAPTQNSPQTGQPRVISFKPSLRRGTRLSYLLNCIHL